MKRLTRTVVLVLAAAGVVLGVQSLAMAQKLPKCATVKCHEIGCPADVLCVSGSKVLTCAQVCGGN
jgi:hypothetical protein